MSNLQNSSIDKENEDHLQHLNQHKGSRRISGAPLELEDKRVSFQEEVAVRYLSPTESTTDSIGTLVLEKQKVNSTGFDTVESLSTEDTSSYQVFDAPSIDSSSLDMLCEDIIAESQKHMEEAISYPASTSKASSRISKVPITYEDCFSETDLYMKETYPKYYQFLQTHIITALDDTQERKNQEAEFKEAIVGCRQYPPEYFEDLENTLKIYNKINRREK